MSDTYTKIRNEVLSGGDDAPRPDQTVTGWRAVAGVALIVALFAWLGVANIWWFVLVVGLVVMILIHELGHFATAKWTGMKVTQYFFGFGTRLWSFRRGEVEYGVRAIPAGGFVKIVGMTNLDEVDPVDEPRAYRNKSYPRRLLVITAGSMMHMVLAAALLFGVYAVNGRRIDTHRVNIFSVSEGTPAASAGIKPGDIVVSLDGTNMASAEQFVTAIQSHPVGTQVTIGIDRNGTSLSATAALSSNPNVGQAYGKGFLGVSSGTLMGWDQGSVARAAVHSVADLGSVTWQSVGGIVKVMNPVNIVQHLTGKNNDLSTRPTTLYGATRAAKTIGDETGLGGVLLTLAGISVFVGLVNLLPVLPFDGGHAAIATYERLRSRRGRTAYHADVNKMVPMAVAVMVLLVLMALTGLYLDITKPL